MRLNNPVLAKRAYLDILEALPTIEAGAAALVDPVKRNRKVVELARLDQKLAELRDVLVEAGCSDFAG